MSRCELCEKPIDPTRYLCVGCSAQLGVWGTLRERRESLERKRARLDEPEERAACA